MVFDLVYGGVLILVLRFDARPMFIDSNKIEHFQLPSTTAEKLYGRMDKSMLSEFLFNPIF